MITFKRADQRIPDHGMLPPPLSWDYLKPNPHSSMFKDDLALATCANNHTCRIVSNVHSVAADGELSPSYVCPVPGCGFHEFVRFEGWGQDPEMQSLRSDIDEAKRGL